MTVGHEHIWVVYQLGELNEHLKPHGCYMRTQQPITLPPDSEPEPDGAILRGLPTDFKQRLPLPMDILTVIEVADSSLQDDRTVKQRLYANAGIPKYILINLVDHAVEVRTNPLPGNGRYANSLVLKPGETIELLLPDGTSINVPVESLLP